MSEEIRPSVLVLLEGDQDAQRLVATWHLVGEGVDSAQGAIAAAARWAPLAGVAEPEVVRVVPSLWAAGILQPNGLAAEKALDWITDRTERLATDGRRRR